MQAYQLVEWQQAPELRDVEVPEPGPGEVLIKVGGAGACHSDLHVMEWPAGTLPYELPFTLGHENAGWIEAVGAGRHRLGRRHRRSPSTGRGAAGAAARAAPRSRRCASAERRSAPPAAAWAATAGWPSTCWCPTPACSCRSATSTRATPRRCPTPR